MSEWQDHGIEQKVTDILKSIKYGDHHFGRPFITAYQLAIEFRRQHPGIMAQLPVGGLGTGGQSSLAQYLALELSRRIKAGTVTAIEGAFLDDIHLEDISFKGGGGTIHSSLTGSPYPLSMFRMRE